MKIIGKLKKKILKFVKPVFQFIKKRVGKHIPCNARPAIMYVMETLVDNLVKNGGSLSKAVKNTYRTAWKAVYGIIFNELVPAAVRHCMRLFKVPKATFKVQASCQRARWAVGCGETIKAVAPPAELGGLEDWDIYPKSDTFTFYVVRGDRRYFRHAGTKDNTYGTRNGNDCLLPERAKQCLTPELMFSSNNTGRYTTCAKGAAGNPAKLRRCRREFKPACVAEFSIKMLVCNTCCCKKSTTIDSRIISKLRYETDSHPNPNMEKQKEAGEECAAFFTWADGLVRSVWGVTRNLVGFTTFNNACWRGKPNDVTVLGYKESLSAYMKEQGSACPYF